MLNPIDVHEPLSDSELDDLDDFLSSDSMPDDCMDLYTLHGFLTALAVGPDLVTPTEWLSVMWCCDEGPEFDSFDEAQYIVGLVMRLHNSVVRTLEDSPKDFVPIIDSEELADGEVRWHPEDWCKGFILGTYVRHKEWATIVDDEEHSIFMAPIFAFLDDGGLEAALTEDGHGKLTRSDLVGLIGPSVVELKEYWRSRSKPNGSGLAPGHGSSSPGKPGLQ
ncbi:MAG TPA: UPF0149 family protein [Terriglobia bacterium]|nr:UPF0149 family protein [Terriglobia bacterium]